MTLTTITFVLFLFSCFGLFYVFPSPFRFFVLSLINIVFIAYYSIPSLIFVVVFTLISYLLGFVVKKRSVVIFSFLIIIAFTFIKYYHLLDYQFIVPLGLSFYVFKIISYLVDISQKRIKPERNIIYYLNYIMFFPTFLAGPITRFKTYKSSIIHHKFNYLQSKNGLILFFCGVFEKVVIADFIGNIVYQIYQQSELTGIYMLIAICLYALQIYLDFDSYSNIAIGCAKILGIDVGVNFKNPYLASNLKEFWRRWHISLTSWFRDYVYIPLGGSRKYKWRNVLIVFTLSGVWHGSTLNFLIWGLGHGVVLNIEEKFFLKKTQKTSLLSGLKKILGICLNFIIVAILFVFFRFQHFSDAINVLVKAFIPMSFNHELLHLSLSEWYWLLILIGLVIVLEICRNKTNMVQLLARCPAIVRWFVYIAMMIIFLIFGIYGSSYNPVDFIYKHF